MSEQQKLSLRPRESVSKCIYCHESLNAVDSFKTCSGCSACIHTECDSTGICLIPGCGLAFKTDKKTQTLKSQHTGDNRPYQDRMAVTSAQRSPEPFQYPKVEGLNFLTKIWLLCGGSVYLAWILWTVFQFSLRALSDNSMVICFAPLLLAAVGGLLENSYDQENEDP